MKQGDLIHVKKTNSKGEVVFDYGQFIVGEIKEGNVQLLLPTEDDWRKGKIPLDFLYN